MSQRRSAALLLACLAGRAAGQDEGWITHHVALAPDQSLVALGSMHAEEGTSLLITRDAAADRERQRVPFAFGPVRDHCFSADGSLLVTAVSNGAVRVFRAEDLELLHEHSGHQSWVLCVALSPDNTLVASGGRDDTLRLREVATGRELWRAEGVGVCGALEFLPDGSGLLASHFEGPLALWKRDGTRLELRERASTAADLEVSRDGRWLACVHRNGTLSLWDLADRTLVWERELEDARTYAASFAPDGARLATVGSAPGVRVWERADGGPVTTLPCERSLLAVRWGAQEVVAADYEGGVHRWPAPTGR